MSLIPPYGDKLTCLMAEAPLRDRLLRESATLPSLTLNTRQLCDLELLLNGALSPLQGYMGQADFNRVQTEMRLVDDTFWPVPIALDLDTDQARNLSPGSRITLRDTSGKPLAILSIGEIWATDKAHEMSQNYGSDQADIPAHTGSHYAGGHLEGLSLPRHEDFSSLRLTPAEIRATFTRRGQSQVIAFQPCHAMHRAQFELTRHSAQEHEAGLLIQAITSEVPDADFFTRIRCLQKLLPHYPADSVQLGLLPRASCYAGIRDVLWQAIVARNYGCSHLVIGGDSRPGELRRGSDALTPERIQPLAEYFALLGIEPITFPRMLYVPELGQYMPEEYIPAGQPSLSMPTHELQQRILDGREAIPEWASFPEVVEELQKRHPPRIKRGLTVFFTGLSGAGKTTLSQALEQKLMELTGRPVTLLDGDIVRTLLSSGLSYSRTDRNLNIRRIGFVAAEITRQGGIAICAPIAPYRETRQAVRDMIEPLGGFFEVHVSTPLEVCEARDPKGLYAKARAGTIKEFTGISDPYEKPHAPEVSINTGNTHVAEAVEQIVNCLRGNGYLA